MHAELKLLATPAVAREAQSAIDGAHERMAIVEAAFEGTSQMLRSIEEANNIQEERVQGFIDEASRELGVTKR